jgi:hypothetical protein
VGDSARVNVASAVAVADDVDGGDERATAAQAPDEAGVVVMLVQQAQALQLETCRAEAAQQQPPRHRLEAQSNALAQDSPGEKVVQVPVLAWQVRQPKCAAAALQQNPPRQAPERQVEFKVHAAPVATLVLA